MSQHEDFEDQWEIVLVTYSAGAMTRTFDSKSDSPTGALIDFSAGNKRVPPQVAAMDPRAKLAELDRRLAALQAAA